MTDKNRLGLQIPLKLYKRICDKAEEKGSTKNALISEILWQYFESKESEAERK